jgi:excisionase family DNA binding protein
VILNDSENEREVMVMAEQQQLMDVSETATMLRLKESTVRSWILKRKIPYCKLGRRVFVRRSDAEDLINNNVVYPKVERAGHAVF